eukprot:1426807-Pleurochrysis_carterae.AAC.1
MHSGIENLLYSLDLEHSSEHRSMIRHQSINYSNAAIHSQIKYHKDSIRGNTHISTSSSTSKAGLAAATFGELKSSNLAPFCSDEDVIKMKEIRNSVHGVQVISCIYGEGTTFRLQNLQAAYKHDMHITEENSDHNSDCWSTSPAASGQPERGMSHASRLRLLIVWTWAPSQRGGKHIRDIEENLVARKERNRPAASDNCTSKAPLQGQAKVRYS